MPNGSGVLFGCLQCRHFIKGEDNPLIGNCKKYNIDTSMSFICNDMVFREIHDGNSIYRKLLTLQRQQLVKYHTRNLESGILYFYSEVSGFGYPPPIERVPFASIGECTTMNETTRQQYIKEANNKALEHYQIRLKK